MNSRIGLILATRMKKMMTLNDFKGKWDAMPIYANAFLLLDCNHPVEFNIGYEELNQKTLLVMHSGEIHNIASSKSIVASNYQFPDGTWVLTFRLVRNDNEDVFLRFCWDIIESSRNNNGDKIEFILQRYKKWLKLMEYNRQDIMSGSMQKGLLGELLFLKELISTMGDTKAVNSWSGPDDADQDFIYDNTWTEIKAVSADAERVEISSIEQLDNNIGGTLRVYYLETTTPDNALGFTLAKIVSDVKTLISGNPEAKELFEHKIFMYGYEDKPCYDFQKYRLCKVDEYDIRNNFPRITKDSINPAIVRAQYSISFAAIEDFKK
jgi:hypothetical protein